MKLKHGGKYEKTLFNKFLEIYKEFAENTSIHGLKYTVSEDYGRKEKIFWVVALICCLGGAAYMTVLFWERYTSNPARTTIQTAFAPNTIASFPTITLCNVGRASEAKIAAFLDTLTVTTEDRKQIEPIFGQLPFLRDSSDDEEIPKYEQKTLLLVDEILKKNNYTNLKEVLKKVSMNCEEMLLRCSWNTKDVRCAEIFDQTFTADGACCSFNYLSEKRQTARYSAYYGRGTGLRILINPTFNDSMSESLDLIKVIIHNPNTYPGTQSNLKIVAAGTISYLQVSVWNRLCSQEVLSLSTDHRQCVYGQEKKLRYFSQPYMGYSVSNCFSECAARCNYKMCGCVPYYYEFAKDKPVCNVNGTNCTEYSTYDITNCKCPSQCEEIGYNIFSTVTNLVVDQNFSTMDYLSGYNVNNKTIWLNVYFLGNRQTIYFRDVITSKIYLISSFGGVYGLFIGCSLVTIVEIIYYFIIRFGIKRFQEKELPKDLKNRNITQNKIVPKRKNISVISSNNHFGDPTAFIFVH